MIGEPTEHQRVNLRKSHPLLFHTNLTISCGQIALALNFWGLGVLPPPAFNPYGIDKDLVGFVFFAIAFSQIFFMILARDLRLVRITVALSICFMLFWGMTNTQQVFAGMASFQLPILFVTLSAVQIFVLIEAPRNPFTERK